MQWAGINASQRGALRAYAIRPYAMSRIGSRAHQCIAMRRIVGEHEDRPYGVDGWH
jgi:hypothetical protein